MYICVCYNVVTQWEKPDTLQQANTAEQTVASSEEQTVYQQANTRTVSSEGDAAIAGVKRSSSDDSSSTNDNNEVKKAYDGRGYCRGGAYGSWTVLAVRFV